MRTGREEQATKRGYLRRSGVCLLSEPGGCYLQTVVSNRAFLSYRRASYDR